MSLNGNINDDSTLAYLFNKTRQGASDALQKAIDKINDALIAINNTIASIQTTLNNKVSKSGDTMTGALTLQNSRLNIKNTNADTTAQTDTAARYWSMYMQDKNAKIGSYIESAFLTNGQSRITISSRRVVNGSNVDNSISLNVNADGTKSVSVSDAAPWRSALRVVNKAGDTMTDTLIVQKDTTIAQNYPSQIKLSPHQTDNNLTYGSCYIAAYDDHDTANNGANMVIQSGSNMIIGSGESPANLYATLYKDSAAENMVIGGDGTIEFFTNCQTIANRVNTRIDTSGNFTGKAANVTGTVAIANGGTGATTAADARTNLGLGSMATVNSPVPIANGGTGQTGVTTVTTTSSIATAASGVTIVEAKYTQWGKMATVRLVMKKNAAISTTTHLATMVSGKRPAVDTTAHVATTSDHTAYITTDGKAYLNVGNFGANLQFTYTCVFMLA